MSVIGSRDVNTEKRVFVTRNIPRTGLDMLEAATGIEVDLWDGEAPPCRETLLERSKGAAALLCLLSDRVDEELLDMARDLSVVANYAVGYDNIDVDAATSRGVWVSNTPGVLTESTADLAFALILSAARRIVEADTMVRAGKFKGWGPRLLLGLELSGATIGIVGFGRIGRAVAQRARGFGMRVVYSSRTRMSTDQETLLDVSWRSLDSLTRESDVISLHVPGGKETQHLFDRTRLEQMKPGAILVNTARGTVIDERALVDCLSSGHLRAAGLDVFEREPEVTSELLSLPNVVLAPHIGSATDLTRNRMAEIAAQNVIKALLGEKPPNAINHISAGGR